MLSVWLWVLAGAYLLGSVPFAYLIGRLNGVDIRQHGSGNVGATNVLRVVGKPWGITCFALDFLKGFLPVLGAVLYVRANLGDIRAADALSPIAACAGAVSGHIWPVWLRFRGGKGMATSVGALLALAPLPVLLGVTAWVAVFKLSRYVSLASIIAVLVMRVILPGEQGGVYAGVDPADQSDRSGQPGRSGWLADSFIRYPLTPSSPSGQP